MTTPLFDLPQVQSALQYVFGKLADWQRVPGRISIARREVTRLATKAQSDGDTRQLAQLTILLQSLAGIEGEYDGSAAYMAAVLDAARTVQAGGSIGADQAVEAAKLAATMTSGLAALHATESAIVDLGGTLTPGPGGMPVAAWLTYGLVGLGAWWLYRAARRR